MGVAVEAPLEHRATAHGRTVTTELGPPRALPAEAPLLMPRARVNGRRRTGRGRRTRRQRWCTTAARLYLAVFAALLGGYGCYRMYEVVAPARPVLLQWLFLLLFAVNFLAISIELGQATLGF